MFVLQLANGQDDNEVNLDDLPTKLTGLTEVTTDYVFLRLLAFTPNIKSPDNNCSRITPKKEIVKANGNKTWEDLNNSPSVT